jgi:hypothetical protein
LTILAAIECAHAGGDTRGLSWIAGLNGFARHRCAWIVDAVAVDAALATRAADGGTALYAAAVAASFVGGALDAAAGIAHTLQEAILERTALAVLARELWQ